MRTDCDERKCKCYNATQLRLWVRMQQSTAQCTVIVTPRVCSSGENVVTTWNAGGLGDSSPIIAFCYMPLLSGSVQMHSTTWELRRREPVKRVQRRPKKIRNLCMWCFVNVAKKRVTCVYCWKIELPYSFKLREKRWLNPIKNAQKMQLCKCSANSVHKRSLNQ